LFDKFGSDRTKELMDDLNQKEYYKLNAQEIESLREDFRAFYSDDSFAKTVISEYASNGYIMDPHNATCIKAYNDVKCSKIKCIICSTAEWTKFAPTMANAIECGEKEYNDIEALKILSKNLNLKIPEKIKALFEKEIVHSSVVEKEEIEKEILLFLKKSD